MGQPEGRSRAVAIAMAALPPAIPYKYGLLVVPIAWAVVREQGGGARRELHP